MKIEDMIEELTWMILILEQEVKELKDTNALLESYLQVYEAIIRGEQHGNEDTSRTINQE